MELKTVWTGGHAQTVLCLAVGGEGAVASGGEEGELCLWSPEGRVESKRLLPSRADVNSVCFSPGQPSVLYLSAGPAVEVLDVRSPDDAVAAFAFGQEDVNQVAVDSADAFLATCDDDGAVRVVDAQSRKLLRTLRGHGNICSGLAFRPRARREAASGGLDCVVNAWDVSRGRSLASVNTQTLAAAAAAKEAAGDGGEMASPYLINPPFVHSVDYSAGGDLLACGLENARVQLLERRGRRSLRPRATLAGHRLGVTQVRFLPDRPGQDPDLLLSAGNDCQLILWDASPESLAAMDGKEADAEPSASGRPLQADSPPTSRGQAVAGDETGEDESVGQGACASGEKRLQRFCQKHKDKINWIAPVCTTGAVNNVLVADVSSVISVYQWQ